MINNAKKFGISLVTALSVYSCSPIEQNLKNCLDESEVKLYWADWPGFCHDQKDTLGNLFKEIKVVDYDLNRAECDSAGIRGYPTWSIKGELYPGYKNLDTLSYLTGCEFLRE